MSYQYGNGIIKQLAKLQAEVEESKEAEKKAPNNWANWAKALSDTPFIPFNAKETAEYEHKSGELVDAWWDEATTYDWTAINTGGLTYDTVKAVKEYATKFKSGNVFPYVYTGLPPEGWGVKFQPSKENIEAAEAIDREFEQWMNEEE